MDVLNIQNFLKELSQNNNREWFAAHKEWYDKCKADFDEISRLLIMEIAGFDAEIRTVEPRDCVFMIYRDTRFAKDKTPYKNHFGVFIAAEGGRKSERAGYYFHIEPEASFLAAGVWCPPPPLLKVLRKSVYDNIEELTEIRQDAGFSKYFNEFYDDDKLKTVPAGFPKDFEHAELLKLKHYMVEFKMDDDFLKQKDLVKSVAGIFNQAYPLNRFLNYAVDEYKGRV